MRMKRKVNAIWNGDGANGKGFLTAQSGAFNKMPYSFKTRFENDNGDLGTNPEELIASALAGCFNMKLAFVLNEANFNPTELDTNALLTFIDSSVTSIELTLKGKVPDLNEEKFIELAQDAKNNCPISSVLNCEIILNASLV
ncbi:OsmC family peroxiredoxin [Flavobacteriaceae bacterium]|nr:OsmC family peroxiredoxin [Flavobacteriaceae bacterium]